MLCQQGLLEEIHLLIELLNYQEAIDEVRGAHHHCEGSGHQLNDEVLLIGGYTPMYLFSYVFEESIAFVAHEAIVGGE